MLYTNAHKNKTFLFCISLHRNKFHMLYLYIDRIQNKVTHFDTYKDLTSPSNYAHFALVHIVSLPSFRYQKHVANSNA